MDDQEPISPSPSPEALASATERTFIGDRVDIKAFVSAGLRGLFVPLLETLWRDCVSIHSREYLNGGDVVVVDCTHQSNVLVMDDANFNAYRRGSASRYYGGFFERLPARISVPHSGNWNVVLEVPRGARYGLSVVRY